MKQQHKLSSGEQQEQTVQARTAKTTAKEFGSVEELLRHDAAQTVVPPEIARRLEESARQAPPKRPWWRRLLG
jgi:hypothetical protein